MALGQSSAHPPISAKLSAVYDARFLDFRSVYAAAAGESGRRIGVRFVTRTYFLSMSFVFHFARNVYSNVHLAALRETIYVHICLVIVISWLYIRPECVARN